MDKAPFGDWEATTVAAAVWAGGVDAVRTCDGAINGGLFVAYVERCLVPTLKPGDVLILDGLSSHERAEARGLVEAAGASVRFLPPYSPDYNPIEQAFSKLKATLRRREGRKAEGLRAAIFAEFNDFPPEERANFLRNDGYAATPKPMPF